MPVSKKNRITPENPLPTSEPSSPLLPEQQAFHQHLRALAQSAVRTVVELVMRGENAVPSAKAIATAPTRVIWRQRQGGSRRSKSPEIGKVSSTPRHLNATVAMNPTLQTG